MPKKARWARRSPHTDSMVATYAPILLLFILALGVTLVMFSAGHLLGPKNPTTEKQLPFECGSESTGGNQARLSVKFYLTAILFVVFDIEAIFIYPWAVTFREQGWVGFLTMLSFLSLLVVGLIYCWKKGALEWER